MPIGCAAVLGYPVGMPESETSFKAIPPSEMKGRRIGRIFVKMQLVKREQVSKALAVQKERAESGQKVKVGEVLRELGFVTDHHIAYALAGQAGMQLVELDPDAIPAEAIDALPAETATSYQIAPVSFDAGSNRLVVALKSPDNFQAIDNLRLLLNFDAVAVIADAEAIDQVIAKHYANQTAGTSNIDFGSEELSALEGRGDSVDLEDLVQAAGSSAVVRLINMVLMQAIRDKASDIHLEPFEDEFKMRYRIDGVLYEMSPPPPHLAMPIVSRVKVMSNLDIAERRLPQDGRIELTLGGSPVDLRVAVLPTMFGESVVMRVLDRGNVQLSLDNVGLRPDDLETVRDLIKRPNGIVVVTGPTGSGKTTTLYSCLNELNDPETKILTAEDPVEYDIDGLIQCQINPDQELTFAKLLRSFLRQDPDIILVGEIRDLETAQIAVQASLTGHLVFTTVHTNDAPSTVLRLTDLGMEPFLLTATIEAIVAQRLVRRICVGCKQAYEPSEEELMELDLRTSDVEGRTFFRGTGCDKCNNTGFKGRMALFEILVMDDKIRELVMQQVSTTVIRDAARRRGMRTLRESGLLAIYEGQTTIDEVVRETITDE